jgi:hypothetical protein
MNAKKTAMTMAENVDPIDDSQISESALPASRSRTGKIARLPLAVRRQLNQRLQDGQQGRQLVTWLNGLPEVQAVLAAEFNGHPIVEQNLSAWKKGGYQDWEEEQTTLEAVATLREQSTGLQEAAKDGLTDRMTLVLTAKMAVELKRLNSVPDGEKKAKIWRELLGGVMLLRRGELQGQRLSLEREKIALRRELHDKETEEAFWLWVDKEENRDKVLERLLPPEECEEEKERRAEETQRKIREILGTD